MSLLAWFLVILLTFIALYLGVGWLLDRGNRELERVRLLAQLDEVTANVQLPRAGYLPGPQFAEPAPAPVPWDLAGAAYALGQQRASQDEVTRQVEEIMLEVELDPRWKYR